MDDDTRRAFDWYEWSKSQGWEHRASGPAVDLNDFLKRVCQGVDPEPCFTRLKGEVFDKLFRSPLPSEEKQLYEHRIDKPPVEYPFET